MKERTLRLSQMRKTQHKEGKEMKAYEVPSAKALIPESAYIITLSGKQTLSILGDHHESVYSVWYDKLGK